jgi:hypothetical protein
VTYLFDSDAAITLIVQLEKPCVKLLISFVGIVPEPKMNGNLPQANSSEFGRRILPLPVLLSA